MREEGRETRSGDLRCVSPPPFHSVGSDVELGGFGVVDGGARRREGGGEAQGHYGKVLRGNSPGLPVGSLFLPKGTGMPRLTPPVLRLWGPLKS